METYALGWYPAGEHGNRVVRETARLEAFIDEALAGAATALRYELAIGFAVTPHRHVAEIAADRRADLIVVGDDRSRLARALGLGFAQRLRSRAPCPVISLRGGTRSSLLEPPPSTGERPAFAPGRLALLAANRVRHS